MAYRTLHPGLQGSEARGEDSILWATIAGADSAEPGIQVRAASCANDALALQRTASSAMFRAMDLNPLLHRGAMVSSSARSVRACCERRKPCSDETLSGYHSLRRNSQRMRH